LLSSSIESIVDLAGSSHIIWSLAGFVDVTATILGDYRDKSWQMNGSIPTITNIDPSNIRILAEIKGRISAQGYLVGDLDGTWYETFPHNSRIGIIEAQHSIVSRNLLVSSRVTRTLEA
jgi:hypothetical protein